MTSKEFKEKIENSPTILDRHMLLVDEEVMNVVKDLEILEEIKENHPDLYNLYKKMKEAERKWLNDEK